MKFGVLSMIYDPATSSWRMSQGYLQQIKAKQSTEFSKILPRAGYIDLSKNFKNSLIICDKVENINPRDLPEIDILTAGFPCQPVSVAGQQKGLSDERWLWDEVWRFINDLRPRYFLLENVPGLFTANKGEAINRVLKDIAESRLYRFE